VRTFGKTDLIVSEFGLGCARLGGVFQRDTKGFLSLLSAARESGINFFDTADMYSQGESEVLIGRAFRRVRSTVVIASKAGFCLPARRRFAARLKPLLRPAIQLLGLRRNRLPSSARGVVTQNFSPTYLRRSVEGSLRRLRTDYLDLFQLHSPPADVVERGDWEPALDSLRREGKIRHYGISCDTPEAGLAALKYPGVSSLQFVVNLLERRASDILLPQARSRGIAVIARECLANGLLVKRLDEIDLAAYCASPEEQGLRREQLTRHNQEAADRGRSLGRLALEYAAGCDGVSVTLLGARSVDQLRGLLQQIEHRQAATAQL
jgi:aryl-alcohol dehydrogenase-like predicted oxidoreductase